MTIQSRLASAQPIAGAKSPRVACATPRARSLALALATALGAIGSAGTASSAPQATMPFDPDSGGTTPQSGATWTVANCNDAGAGSLRDAAAHAIDGDTIDLSNLTCSTISVTSGTITLAGVRLLGPGADALTIDGLGNQNRRIFDHVAHSTVLDIRDVTIHGGKYLSNAGRGGACLRTEGGGTVRITDSVFDGCIAFAPTGTSGNVRGGAIAAYNDVLDLIRVTLTNNQARAANGNSLGGAVYMRGSSLWIEDSTLSDNSATAIAGPPHGRGGAVFAHGRASIYRSTIDGNLAQGPVGGVLIESGGTLVASTVSNNVSTGGPSGIAFLGALGADGSVYSSTISGNQTQASVQGGSGALYMNTKSANIMNSTIADNLESNVANTPRGAGIVFGAASASQILVRSTIAFGSRFEHDNFAFNSPDIVGPAGATVNGDHNLINASTLIVPADTIQGNPGLGPLQDNGGPTFTRMPAINGPAFDHGNDNGQATDQRGYPRVDFSAADIGAVEVRSDPIFHNGFEWCTLRCFPD